MATFTPSWTDAGGTVVSPQCLTRGNSVRGTIDLRTKYGAFLLAGIGRGGTTALTNGVNFIARRVPNNDGVHIAADFCNFVTATAAAILKLVNFVAGYAAGEQTLTIDGTGTPSASDIFCLWGVGAIPANGTALSTLEFLRCSLQAGGTSITFDTTTKQAHADNEYLTSKAECYCVWLPGGSVYEVIFDYGDDTAGEAVAVACYHQTYASDTSA